MTISTLQAKFDEPIPSQSVSTRPGGAGKTLSYLESWYVIDRLNQVVGTEAWSSEIKELILLDPSSPAPSYRAIVRITLLTGGYATVKEGVGYGNDKPDRNGNIRNPHELAMKEAVSDAFKTAAKNLGRSMGLALYDKSHEYVVDSPVTPIAKAGVANPPPPPPPASPGPVKFTKPDPKNVIKTALNCLLAQRKIEKQDFIAKFLNGKDSWSALTENEATSAIERINAEFPHLKLV